MPLTSEMSDLKLLMMLYPKRVHREGYTQPDFYSLEKDKKKRKLTIFVMWRRYHKRTLAAEGNPYGKSQFFKIFQIFRDPFNRGFRSQTIETIKSLFVFLPATYFTNESRILTRRKLGESLFCGAKNAPRPQKVVARE